MPAFKLTFTSRIENSHDIKEQEWYYDNGSHAFLEAMHMMAVTACSMPTKHLGHQLLSMVEAGGNMNPVIEYYNKWNEQNSIKVERVFFQDSRFVYGFVNKDLIDECRERISSKDVAAGPPRYIVIQKNPAPEELRELEEARSSWEDYDD